MNIELEELFIPYEEALKINYQVRTLAYWSIKYTYSDKILSPVLILSENHIETEKITKREIMCKAPLKQQIYGTE